MATRKARRNASRHFSRQTGVGAPPGEIRPAPGSPAPKMRVIAFGPDGHEEHEITDPDQIRPLLGKRPVLWLNVDGLGNAATIARIGEIFGLHKLALEDVVNVHQRAKVEPYGDQVFIVVRESITRTASTPTRSASSWDGTSSSRSRRPRATRSTTSASGSGPAAAGSAPPGPTTSSTPCSTP